MQLLGECLFQSFHVVAVWPQKKIMSTYSPGRVAANKTSPYFDHGSMAATPNKTPNLGVATNKTLPYFDCGSVALWPQPLI